MILCYRNRIYAYFTTELQLIIACKTGGTSIEDLAEKHPELIVKVTLYSAR